MLAKTIFDEYFKENAPYKIELSKKAYSDILMKFGSIDYTDTILRQVKQIDNSLNNYESTYVSPTRNREKEEEK